MSPCETCAKNLALRGNKHCLTCWNVWWRSVMARKTGEALELAEKRGLFAEEPAS